MKIGSVDNSKPAAAAGSGPRSRKASAKPPPVPATEASAQVALSAGAASLVSEAAMPTSTPRRWRASRRPSATASSRSMPKRSPTS